MINFATIGTSSITEKMIDAIARVDGARVTAVYSRNADTGREFGEKFGISTYFDSIESLAGDKSIDAVYVASPNSIHFEQVITLLKGRKHVLCEKSIASNAAEAEKMFQTAYKNGVILLEAMRSLYDPGYAMIKSHLADLGKIRRARIEYCKYSSKYDSFKAGNEKNIFMRELSAGALMDIGVYCVEIMIGLFHRPETVRSASVLVRGGADGCGTILAHYPDKIAELCYSKITDSENVSEIQGEDGVMYIDQIDSPTRIRIKLRNGEESDIKIPIHENNMQFEVEFFTEVIKNKGSRTQDDLLLQMQTISLQAMEILEDARKQCGINFPADQNII